MATVVDYQYIPEVSTLDALHNLASDTTNWYSQELPWVNTFLINWANQITNIPAWEWGWIAWRSTNVSWTSSAHNRISWSSWYIYLPDWSELPVSSGSANLSWMTYIYYNQEDQSVYYTTSWMDAVWEWKILLCVAWPTTSWKDCSFQAFWTNSQSTFITADNIAANTITGNEIQANSIDTAELKSWAVTAGKIDVSQLSAISANLWSITAWDITGTTITAWSTSGTAIKLNPNNNRIEFYYNWRMVGYMAWWSVDGNWWILINADFAGMTGRDTFDLYNGMLRIPVWNNLYN